MQFKLDYEFLSNFSPSIIYVDGEKYLTLQHAYCASKTLDPWTRRTIRLTKTPIEAINLSKGIKLRYEWCEEFKIKVMEELLYKKFENPFLQHLLLNTGCENIIYENENNDIFWGVYKGIGLNKLGILLENIRKAYSEKLKE